MKKSVFCAFVFACAVVIVSVLFPDGAWAAGQENSWQAACGFAPLREMIEQHLPDMGKISKDIADTGSGFLPLDICGKLSAWFSSIIS